MAYRIVQLYLCAIHCTSAIVRWLLHANSHRFFRFGLSWRLYSAHIKTKTKNSINYPFWKCSWAVHFSTSDKQFLLLLWHFLNRNLHINRLVSSMVSLLSRKRFVSADVMLLVPRGTRPISSTTKLFLIKKKIWKSIDWCVSLFVLFTSSTFSVSPIL